MSKPGMNFAITVSTIALILALGLPALIGDGARNFPDVGEEIIHDAIATVHICSVVPLRH